MLTNYHISFKLLWCCLLLSVALFGDIYNSTADTATKKSMKITIASPVIVKGEEVGTWNVDIHDLSFSAKAVYVDSNNNIYITNYILWPKKMAITKKYHVSNVDDNVFDPQFSVDGSKVLFKVGWPFSSYSLYTMYLWNIKTNNVHKVRMPFTGSSLKDPSVLERRMDTFRNEGAKPFEYSFPIIKWSPNGRYLSYIRGGNIFGEIVYDNHIFLDTFDLQHKVRHFLVRNDAVPYGYAWTPDNKILYSAIENSTINIYRIRPDGMNRTLLLQNAYRPVASPDGSKIAFFGSEHFNEPIKLRNDRLDTVHARGLSLSVANSDGSQRKALNRENGYYPGVVWMPDNEHLLTITPIVQDKRTSGSRIVLALVTDITMWNIETGKRKHVCEIPHSIFLPFTNPRFAPPQISYNGKILFVRDMGEIKAIDISTGKIYEIGSIKNTSDLQWHLVNPKFIRENT